MVERYFDLVEQNGKKPVRIEWFPEDIEDAEPSEHHWIMMEGWMPGIAEDGSEWRMEVTFTREDQDSWESLDEPELYKPAVRYKTMKTLDYENFYLDHLSRYVENDPARLLVYRMRWGPEELIGRQGDPESEFIKVQEDGETRVRATQKGLKKHLFLKQAAMKFGQLEREVTGKIAKCEN